MRTNMKKIYYVLIVIGVLVIAGIVAYPFIVRQFFAPGPSVIPEGTTLSDNPGVATPPVDTPAATSIADQLEIPWEIAFLPDGSYLVTERPGTLLHIDLDVFARQEVSGVKHQGEGGLLGLALHPDFESNNQVYLYMTTDVGGGLTNRIERYTFADNILADRAVILEGIPGASFHDGGRIAFGPDDKLYVTTGDAGTEQNAQDLNSLAGKILRLNADGSVPEDNPFGTLVWSYGHRNPQGLAWDSDGRLWATEHGPSGLAPNSGQDEVNLIEAGKNYGWPVITGEATEAGLESPIIQSGVNETWAPGGAVVVGNTLYFVGLRGQSLYSADIEGAQLVNLRRHFSQEFGRLRNVALGPDGLLYVLTSNTDGRGSPMSGDDQLIRINPGVL